MKSSTPKIGVFGHYGNQNLGDEAIIEAVIANCRRRYPQAEIACFSVDPSDSAARHRVPAYPIRATGGPSIEFPIYARQAAVTEGGIKGLIKSRLPLAFYLLKLALWCLRLPLAVLHQLKFAWRARKAVQELDVLLISGSNQFLDNFGGAWGFPYTLLLWTVLCKLSGTRVAFLSVGAGPLDSRLGKAFVKTVLRLADYYSFRDAGSLKLVRQFFSQVQPNVLPDLAFSLPSNATPLCDADGAGRIVGLNPMPVYDPRYWPIVDLEKYQSYVTKLAEFVSRLLADGYRIRLFSTQPKDGNVTEDIFALLDARSVDYAGKIGVLEHHSVSELIANLNQLDVVVATRFHGVLLSLYSKKPVVAICYGQKTFDAMADCGFGEHAWKLEDFSTEQLYASFQFLQSTRDSVSAALARVTADYDAALQQQYDRVLGL